MFPQALVSRSLEARLDIIGVCDHNASENVQYIMNAARGKDIKVFPGMEVTSREEVHLIALFDTIGPLTALQRVVYQALPGENDEAAFGCQAIVNEAGDVEGFNNRLLIGSTTLSIEDITKTIHHLGGLVIAAHVDRESFGIIGQLGFIPDNIDLDALELSFRTDAATFLALHPELERFSFISSSDAHCLADIGRATTTLLLKEAGIAECKLAFEGREGRAILE
ncbi:MAG: hypothetical protein M0Q23_04165 [Syntrophales bacterium]|nr:hypothetical protein [Syntrophales bacterium]